MRRLIALLTTALLTLAMLSGIAQAGNHHHDDDTPKHPHAMLHNVSFEREMVEMEGEPFIVTTLEFDRCIDLADNRKLPLTSHHHSVHMGTAGVEEPTKGFTRNAFLEDTGQKEATPSGHIVVPLDPFAPFFGESCDDLTSPHQLPPVPAE